jgi:hypothetical protein
VSEQPLRSFEPLKEQALELLRVLKQPELKEAEV